MKMLFCVLMMVLTLVSLAACGGKNETNSQTPSPPDSQSRLTEKQPASEPDRIDIDLTEFSSNMVYAEVYHMISAPEQCLGKTIKIYGVYELYVDPDIEREYHTCIVTDAAACCSVGLEFAPAGGQDLPKNSDSVTLIGKFGFYEENGNRTYCLTDAVFVS